MSYRVNPMALERVCKILDIDHQRGFREIVITPEQKDPIAVCVVDWDGDNIDAREITIFVNDQLDLALANFVVLHELRHAYQEIHEGAHTQGKYAMQVSAAGFEPSEIMKVDRDPIPESRFDDYQNIPYEKDANDFAYLHEDLYQVIVPG